jgi:GNAT superfamily N-acetyltransferase
VTVRPLEAGDAGFVADVVVREFGAPVVVSRGVAHDVRTLPGFVAEVGGERVGLAVYDIDGSECELVAIAGPGVGAVLLAAVVDVARAAGCRRVWLVTSNDNTRALRFYQRHEFDLVALHRFAIDEARHIKPEIPEFGADGIPIRHELELERRL